MKLQIYTKSRTNTNTYEASAVYEDGKVTVKKGSRININPSDGYNPSVLIKELLKDKNVINTEGILLKDIVFNSLSTSATFVTGRISNGMLAWKTLDGKKMRDIVKS